VSAAGRRGRGGQGGHEPRARIRLRELRATELTVLGWSQHRIAADLGVSQAAVSKILQRIDRRLLQEMRERAEHHKARHTLRLEHVFAEAMHAWDASKADTTRRRQRKTRSGTGDAEGTVAEVVVQNQHGDPRYLEEARKALGDQRKLWGLDAPQKLDVRATRSPYEGMSDEALRLELTKQARLLTVGDITPPAATPITEDVTDDHR
jgi:hypothetical protein